MWQVAQVRGRTAPFSFRLEPGAGEVLWDGRRVADIDMQELRKSRVGFVNQEPLLMEGTIYDNLFYGREEEGRPGVEFLPYNKMAGAKYKMLGMAYDYDFRQPTKEDCALAGEILEGCDVRFRKA